MRELLITYLTKGFHFFLAVTLLLTVMVITPLKAQILPLQDYRSLEGFPHNSVYTITQDQNGYLWIGTESGLSRFDGFRFQTYSMDDGLSGNAVSGIFKSKTGGFWVSTNQGFNHFKPDTIRTFKPGESSFENNIWDIAEDESGNVWLATNGGGIIKMDENENFTRFKTVGGESANTFYAINLLSDGRIWAGGRMGLFEISGDSLISIYEEELPVETLNRIIEDDTGTVWLGYQREGLYRIDPDGVTEFGDLPVSSVRSLLMDDRGSLWIGSDGEGLFVIHSDGKTEHFKMENGLSSDGIGSMFLDREGSVWFGHLYQGLQRLKNRGIKHYRFGPGDISFINHIFESSNGEIWMASFDGAHRLKNEAHHHFAEGVRFWQINETADGKIAGAAIENGLMVFDGEQFQRINNPPGLEELILVGIYTDSQNRTLAGSYWNGLFLLSENELTPYDPGFADIPRTVTQFLETEEGLWVSSFFDGLYKTGGGSVVDLDFFSASDASEINHIWENEGRLWIASDIGLTFLENGTFVDALEKYMLPSGPYSFVIDSGDGLWTASGSTVYHLSGETALQLTHADGLIPASMTVGSANTGRNGNIWIGTVDGAMKIEHGRVDFRQPQPNVEFTRVQLFDKDLDFSAPLKFNHRDNYLKFDFLGLYLSDPQGVTYRYKMDRIDPDWQYSDIATVQYTSLPPGEYRFEVQASHQYGNWDINRAVIDFIILPPFWQTWWFILISLGVTGTILYMIHRFRVSQLLRIERMRMQIAGDLHDEVGSNLSSIALITGMIQNNKNLEPEIKTRIRKVQAASQKTMDAMSNIVWAINPGNDTFEDLVLKMKEVANEMLVNIEHSFEIDDSLLGDKVTLLFKRDLFLIYKEALHNIVKHSEATSVTISVQKQKGHFLLTIRDNGKGFDPGKTYNGIGLQSIKNRAEKLNGELIITSNGEQGTELKVKAGVI